MRARAAFVRPRCKRDARRRIPIPSVVTDSRAEPISPRPNPSHPADTPSADASRAMVPTVGMRKPDSISATVDAATPALSARGSRFSLECWRAFARRSGRPMRAGFRFPRTIGGILICTVSEGYIRVHADGNCLFREFTNPAFVMYHSHSSPPTASPKQKGPTVAKRPSPQPASDLAAKHRSDANGGTLCALVPLRQ